MSYTTDQEKQILQLIKWRRKAIQEERDLLKKAKELTDYKIKQVAEELEELRLLEIKNREMMI
ncbi:hypothetical protein I6N96_01220 [Enterococcus sp. BWM-S5]|uniref:Uncharacterized protein n=1 Tax=Enterococcus larvae TaxID=2794352 RepID=A0ABS4CEF6_9ENTE|nr:hypothetical protein [Enterococcus larvae]MBP1044882.1 hypothetical protein [Enterococcus larvae]